jgi:Beta-lactamase enzyme family
MATTTGRLNGRRVQRWSILLSLAALLISSFAWVVPAHAVTLVEDPERSSTALAGWGWHNAQTPATINAWISSRGQRIVDLEVNSATGPTFTVAYVQNSGAYARTWWWYYGKTEAEVRSLLTTNGARPIDIEPYQTSSGLRFAVVMVRNTGAALKTWVWKTLYTSGNVTTYGTTYGYRPIDIDRYSVSGVTKLSVIFIRNTGVDSKAWWHYYSQTPSQIASNLSTNHARLIEIEGNGGGTGLFDVIMIGGSAPYWWWHYNATATDVSNLSTQHGARPFMVEPYVIGSVTRFAILYINDANAETTRIRQAVVTNMSGNWGFYVKKVGGGDVLGLQPDRVFEPASMIKIIHAVTALRQVQANTGTTLTTNITWYADPAEPARYPTMTNYANPDGTPNDPADKDVCAYNSTTGALLTGATYSDPLGSVIIKQMLGWSDNRTTDALTRRYGFAGINATAALAGMTRSKLWHRPGCPAASSPQPWHYNELTLRDAGRIYEGVENLSLLDATRRTALYGYLSGGVISSNGALATMIKAEASGKLTATELSQFLSQVSTRSKAGGYSLCPATGSCNPPTLQVRTVGGTIWIPFKNSVGTVVKTAYVYGNFVNTVVNCSFASVSAKTCSTMTNADSGMATVSVEMFRAIVRQAIATW